MEELFRKRSVCNGIRLSDLENERRSVYKSGDVVYFAALSNDIHELKRIVPFFGKMDVPSSRGRNPMLDLLRFISEPSLYTTFDEKMPPIQCLKNVFNKIPDHLVTGLVLVGKTRKATTDNGGL